MSQYTSQPKPAHKSSSAVLDPVLQQHLYCPVARKPLFYDQHSQVMISKESGLVYPINNNIPILIEEHATSIDQWLACQSDSAKSE